MKTMVLKVIFRVTLYLVLNRTPWETLRNWIDEAESTMSNNMAKRGYVYRNLNQSEGPDFSYALANMVTEMAVYLRKHL